MLDKNINAWHFKVLSDIYFQSMCIVTCNFLGEKISALISFLNGFGIAVPVFSY